MDSDITKELLLKLSPDHISGDGAALVLDQLT